MGSEEKKRKQIFYEMMSKLASINKNDSQEKTHEVMRDVYKNNVFPLQKIISA